MKQYRVTVIFDVIISAESERQAEEVAGEIELPDNYVIDSFDVESVKEVK